MQGKEWKIGIVIGFILLLHACNRVEPKSDKASLVDSSTTANSLRVLPVCGGMEVKDSITVSRDSITKSTARHINAADKQYLKLVIPDYSEIDLFYEKSPEVLAYITELRQYFISRNCDIHRQEKIEPKSGELKEKRFYIRHIGDNRYFIYVYSEYTMEDHVNL